MASESEISESQRAELIRRMDEAADAYMRGDIHHYLSLFDHSDDYTLMPPYGGVTRHGYEYTEEGAAETSRSSPQVRRVSKCSRPMSRVTSSCWWRWNGSTVRSAVSLTRTGHCGSPLSFAASVTGGSSCIAMPTPLVRQIPFEHCAQLARGLDD